MYVVGRFDGTTEGLIVEGSTEGDEDGMHVGMTEGNDEGLTIGAVGRHVGEGVGIEEGA